MKTARVIILVTLVSLFGSSCALFHNRTAAKNDPTYRAADRAFLAGDWEKAVDLYSRYLDTNPSSPIADEALYYRARAYLKRGNYAAARGDFEYAMKHGKSKQTRGMATVGLADTYFAEERFSQAALFYRKALRKYKNFIAADEVLYRLGLACQRMSLWEEAGIYFSRLCSEFPSSPRAPLARRKVRFPEKFFSVQVGAFKAKSLAFALASRLEKAGFSSYVTNWTSDGEMWYYVRSGHFDTWAEAKNFAKSLREAGFETYIVP